MEKIIILILVVITILILGDSIQSYAQFSIRNDSCHSSFLTPTIDNRSNSFPSSTLIQYEANKEKLSTFEKILNVPIGILLGSFGGYLIGTSIPRRDSEEKLVNGIKGGLVGAFVGPYVNYEIMSAMKGVRNPSNNWCFKAGGNITLPNYNNVKFKPGYSIGISRTYPLSNIIALQGNLAYQSRQFFLPSQKILHGMFSFDHEVRTYDIDFSVSYIDISLLLNFKLITFRKSTLNIAIGPSLSFELNDNTKYHFITLEENQHDFDISYIMDELVPLFGYPAALVNLEMQHGKWIWLLGFHRSLTYTDEIYPLISNSRLSTFNLSIGYKLEYFAFANHITKESN